MEEAEKRLKVYSETTFWSYLNGRPTPLDGLNRYTKRGFFSFLIASSDTETK